MRNGIRLQLGCVMAAEGLLNGSWSALGGLRSRKNVLLNGSWPVQEEFQDRFYRKGGPKWDPQSFNGSLFLRFPIGVRN